MRLADRDDARDDRDLLAAEPTGAAAAIDGTIGQLRFRARYREGRGWSVQLNAC